jgi:predicted outer membrane repeat protein
VNGATNSATVTGSTFTGNQAETGGAIGANIQSLTVTNSTFARNRAGQGGAIAIGPIGPSTTGNLAVSGGLFTGNRSGGLGGALIGTGHSVSVTGVRFSGNTGQGGGAIAVTAGTLTMSRARVTGNVATQLGGGGIRVGTNATAAISNSSVVLNRSFAIFGVSPYPVPGGGLLNLGTATLTGDDVSLNDPDDCAGSGTTTGC